MPEPPALLLPPRVHPFYADLRSLAQERLGVQLAELLRFLRSHKSVPTADRDGGLLEIDRALGNMAAGNADLALARIDRIVQYRRVLPAMQAEAKAKDARAKGVAVANAERRKLPSPDALRAELDQKVANGTDMQAAKALLCRTLGCTRQALNRQLKKKT